jgi:hypothetical protein
VINHSAGQNEAGSDVLQGRFQNSEEAGFGFNAAAR